MKRNVLKPMLLFISVLISISVACVAAAQPTPANISEPTATPTIALTSTATLRPTSTPRPTWTPNAAATQHVEDLIAEVQTYYDKGYIATIDGIFAELDDFSYESASLGQYRFMRLPVSVSDFFMSAHFKWDSALRNSGIAGCGFMFGIQPNDDHYAVFLDRTQIYFRTGNHVKRDATGVEPIRLTGKVKFEYPAQADFTLIVKDIHVYVLVNGELMGEYILPEKEPLRGQLGLAVLSGTNKDFGTHCEMSNLHLWVPNE